MPPSPDQILSSVFGYDSFRGHQEAIIQHLLNGGDALVLMPTGGGKSLCYQIPALIRPGVAVVVSPLIALMRDQVEALRQLGVRAAYLNSTLAWEAARRIENQLLREELDLIYVAPERLLTEGFLSLLARTRLALFAIDEAHCVSQWGHDFRPEYRQLTVLHERFPEIPRCALTATADAPTRRGIVERLGLEQAKAFTSSFDRPNIRYQVVPKQNGRRQLLVFLKREHPTDAGIVYCLSRKRVEEIARFLSEQGFTALPYHAGLPTDRRQEHQARFLQEDGVIMVATVAFGMGIDKPDVRFVAHLELPKSLEGYYQETGRAGRDGLPADAWMTYGLADVITLRQLLAASQAEERHRHVERIKLEAMLGYCESTDCRRQVLLGYFGERLQKPCGNCDACLEPMPTWDGTEAARKALSCVYRTGQRFGVQHLTDVLLGKKTDRIQSFGHHKLSTFGIGTELDEGQWRSAFRQLVAAGLLTVDLERRGGLRLSPQCRPLLRGETTIHFRRDPAPKKTRAQPSNRPSGFEDPNTQTLWESLRAQRLELAREQGVPPYVIFHDATLREIVVNRPGSLAELGCLPGIGERKLEAYGRIFLEVLRAHEERWGRSS
ncbi:MAG: DNA helicase RecQ [Methylohalobius sp. ZOD2]